MGCKLFIMVLSFSKSNIIIYPIIYLILDSIKITNYRRFMSKISRITPIKS
jgi:hypothetical protein